MACADGFLSSKWIDLEDPILIPVQFRHTPTHRGSLAELAKSLASYVSGSRSRYVGRGGTLCKEKSCRGKLSTMSALSESLSKGILSALSAGDGRSFVCGSFPLVANRHVSPGYKASEGKPTDEKPVAYLQCDTVCEHRPRAPCMIVIPLPLYKIRGWEREGRPTAGASRGLPLPMPPSQRAKRTELHTTCARPGLARALSPGHADAGGGRRASASYFLQIRLGSGGPEAQR